MPSTANLTPAASILSTERVVATTAAGATVSVLASGLPVSTAQAAADAAVLASAATDATTKANAAQAAAIAASATADLSNAAAQAELLAYSQGRVWARVRSQLASGVFNRLFFVGDSISTTVAFGNDPTGGAVPAANTVGSRMATRYAATMTVTNTAVSDTCINGYFRSGWVNATLTDRDILSGATHGFNSLRYHGPAPDILLALQNSFEALYAWMALPETAKVRMTLADGSGTLNTAVTRTGTWSGAPTEWSGRYIGFNSTVGATASFAAPAGDTVYVFYQRKNAQAGQLRVDVDGSLKAIATNNFPFTVRNVGSADWETQVLRIGGLTNSTHTVLLTALSGVVSIMGVASFTRATVSGPLVIAPNCIGMSASGWANSATANDPAVTTDGPAWLKGNGGAVRLNMHHKAAVEALAGDGLNVIHLDAFALFNPSVNADIASDDIHPNSGGHAKLFGANSALIDYAQSLRA